MTTIDIDSHPDLMAFPDTGGLVGLAEQQQCLDRELAVLCGSFYTALKTNGLPDKMAEQLVMKRFEFLAGDTEFEFIYGDGDED